MASRARPEPQDHCVSWPDEICDDPVAERARLFAVNLRAAVGSRPLREVGALTGVDHTALSRILDGHVWPDGFTVARLEVRLGTSLWPPYEE
ncbi:helix-turn-helix transcriptional regulator [uncultured Kocuria sp.]|uniref:helix-turn-helix domain-containing protein n=1 Tax=uncultured Kocuria sp. TaxID=259305 RepID=UPI00263A1BE4|nr:helix-turn-helix transcriptional regulator [uncultured Kocuria sp.]